MEDTSERSTVAVDARDFDNHMPVKDQTREGLLRTHPVGLTGFGCIDLNEAGAQRALVCRQYRDRIAIMNADNATGNLLCECGEGGEDQEKYSKYSMI